MKAIRWSLLIAVALFLAVPQLALAQTVLVVPVAPTTPTSPHTTYPLTSTTEVTVVLGATVPSAWGTGHTFSVDWHFGDGSADTTFSFTDAGTVPSPYGPYAYDISTTHNYPASDATGTAFPTTVTVTDTTAKTAGVKVNYYITQESNNLPSRVNVAIDWGLWYLHQAMWRTNTPANGEPVNWGGWDGQSGSGGCTPLEAGVDGVNSSVDFACGPYGSINASNVQAFEVSGHYQNGPASDPFTDDVYRGINRALVFVAQQQAAAVSYTYNPAVSSYICADGSVPTTGDPLCAMHSGQHQYNSGATSCTSPPCTVTWDGNSNGVQAYSADGSGEYSYTTSPFLDMLVASGTPNATATTGSYLTAGCASPPCTYKTIVQDIIDFYGYSQYGSDYDVNYGVTRGDYQYQGGAWLYTPQEGDDNSTSQWGAIAYISAYRGFGLPEPAGVTDFNNVWVTNSQDLQSGAPTGANSFDGGGNSGDDLGAYGYRGSWYYSQEWGPFAMTPSGMVQMALDGIGRTTNTVFGDATTNFDQRWNNSETFYADNFCNSVNTNPDDSGNSYYDAYFAPRAYLYGMYSFTKSMLLHDPSGTLTPIQYLRTQTPKVFTTNTSVPANTIDWYAALSSANGGTDPCDGVAQTLVTYQNNPMYGNVDGHWYGFTADVGYGYQSPYETSWAIIMLRKTVFVTCIDNLAGQGWAKTRVASARIDVSWSGQTNATSYNVLRSSTNGGPYALVGNTTNTAFTDTTAGLVNGNTYYYVVQPLNGTTEICQSNQATITIP